MRSRHPAEHPGRRLSVNQQWKKTAPPSAYHRGPLKPHEPLYAHQNRTLLHHSSTLCWDQKNKYNQLLNAQKRRHNCSHYFIQKQTVCGQLFTEFILLVFKILMLAAVEFLDEVHAFCCLANDVIHMHHKSSVKG